MNLEITYKNQKFTIAYFLRPGITDTLLFIHGLGCDKSDFFGALQTESLKEHSLIALDLPGHGESDYPSSLMMDDLVEIIHLFIEKLHLKDIILIGHSMGGLAALLYVLAYPLCIKAHINVEGTFTIHDCFFSHDISQQSYEEFIGKGFERIKTICAEKNNCGFQTYVKHLHKVNPQAYYEYCPSIVGHAKGGELLRKFTTLHIPACYIYGAENNGLVYLDIFRKGGISVLEIAKSNHWPMLDNPTEFYESIAQFLNS